MYPSFALDAGGAQRVEPRDLLGLVGNRDKDARYVTSGVLRCMTAKISVESV